MERQYNEVTCDICKKSKTCDVGKCPIDLTGEVTVSKNVFYQNQTEKYTNVCTDCINKILDYVHSLEG